MRTPGGALHIAEASPAQPTTERQLATGQWLLSTVPGPGRDRARREWQKNAVTLLPLGTLFSAVRLPGDLVRAAGLLGRKPDMAQVDACLDEVLDGGPVICDPQGRRYYAIVPPSMPESYQRAAEDWRPLGVEILGRGTYLGVPPVHLVEFDKEACVSYWSVPMQSPAMLCAPLAVARLIAAGMQRLGVGGES